MKPSLLVVVALLCAASVSVLTLGQATQPASGPAAAIPTDRAALDKASADALTAATRRVALLKLNDPQKESRLITVIQTHLLAVHNWHQEHGARFAELMPAGGIDPWIGEPFGDKHRQFYLDSMLPKSVHAALVEGLKKDLTQDQINIVFEDYSEPGRAGGKVLFTMNAYRTLIAADKNNPKFTPEEEAKLMEFLRAAAEMSADYKGSVLISQCFEIYKTKCERYLDSQGRNYKALYSAAFGKKPAASAPATGSSPK